jgi:hypothetical protein
MGTSYVALAPSVFNHALGIVIVHGMVFQLVHFMEIQPESLAVGAVVDIDILEFFFVESNITTWAVQSNSSLGLISCSGICSFMGRFARIA